MEYNDIIQTVSIKNGFIMLSCYVQPKASKNAVAGVYDGMLKILLNAPPVDGMANKALIAFISKKLKLSKSKVSIVKGLTSRKKLLALAVNITEVEREKYISQVLEALK